MASPSRPAYMKVTVGCTSCQAKQVVHVATHAELVPAGSRTIVCAECGHGFEVMIPDSIAERRFPA